MKKLIMDHSASEILQEILENGGYCISVKEKTEKTKCMCEYAKRTHKCKCGLYKVKDSK